MLPNLQTICHYGIAYNIVVVGVQGFFRGVQLRELRQHAACYFSNHFNQVLSGHPDPLTLVHVWATLLARASRRGTCGLCDRLSEGRVGESGAIQWTLQVLLDLLSHW